MEPDQMLARPRPAPSVPEHAMTEIDAAIGLVLLGAAVRVRLVGLTEPDLMAGIAVARGQVAGVDVALDRSGTYPSLVVGPRR